MVGQTDQIYSFGSFQLNAAERILASGGRSITLAPKVFDTLLMLVENAGHVLSKDRMMAEIWDDAFVEENNLAQNISALRRALGETAETRFIETVPKFGYRFVASVTAGSLSPQAPVIMEVPAGISAANIVSAPAAIEPPQTFYTRNGDVNIAYQVTGSGDIDIVFVMGWISHLEYFWKHHLFASFLTRLASFSRLIVFDKRGTGLSDHVPINELPTLEQRMEDVHAVMDAVGSKRAALVGISEGGPMCSLFAATYPERTSALVMFGTYAKRIRDDEYPWGPTLEEREAFYELMKRDWGKPVGIEERAPSHANDPEFRNWWATYLRMGASPGAAVALTKMNADIDVRDVLPLIRVPTLVIHRKGDECLKAEEGRYVASRIPGCKYVELDGNDHLPFVGDQKAVLDEIEEFLTGIRHPERHDRVLATVMCIQLADAAQARGRLQAAAQARNFVRRQLELFKGREVIYGNGGVLATFDGPARAIRCAAAIRESAKRLGIELKIGLHTGECDVVDGKYGGFAVGLAKKIAEISTGESILASRTVKDLVAGSGIMFEESEVRSFEGIEGDWRLFKVSV